MSGEAADIPLTGLCLAGDVPHVRMNEILLAARRATGADGTMHAIMRTAASGGLLLAREAAGRTGLGTFSHSAGAETMHYTMVADPRQATLQRVPLPAALPEASVRIDGSSASATARSSDSFIADAFTAGTLLLRSLSGGLRWRSVEVELAFWPRTGGPFSLSVAAALAGRFWKLAMTVDGRLCGHFLVMRVVGPVAGTTGEA